ncbi:N amino acid transport system protein [Penicillium malachiteum]|uniref:N amino acid transport system protein n=1 Tax=Penicillium malachiteum TaxID=1324776 RepID=UPI00254927DA|nr:N amino acid transport system protein [Penicillium malachiteum]KAJ5720905.1 N amino acid transport system protein [Penicillium malachiteum]
MYSKKGADVDQVGSDPIQDVTLDADMNDREKQIYQGGMEKFNRLGWKRLTIVLIVEAVALGSLSIPGTFATLGMVAGVICCVGIGLIAVYTSYIIGQVKVKFPHISNYPEAGRQMFGRWGYEILYIMLCLELLLSAGSHCLTGTIAFTNITDSNVCAVVFGVVSAIILLIFAIPPSFSEMAILGYIDFTSVILAIGITIIGTGVEATNSTGGLAAVSWSAWPKEGITFADAFIALSNIIFAYSFALCQFSFMDEMHTPTDFPKSIWALGIAEIIIYTLTGALCYAFVGQDVQSPALLSAGSLLSRVAFGVALPVIFISGSINTVVLGRLIHGRIFEKSNIRFVNTKMGWTTWLVVVAVLTILEFVVAEVIPFFDDLLSIISSLFVSGFTFYFPAIMWFMFIREGSMFSSKNLLLTVINAIIFAIGLIVLVAGTYASVVDIVSCTRIYCFVSSTYANLFDQINSYADGTVGGVFSCTAS